MDCFESFVRELDGFYVRELDDFQDPCELFHYLCRIKISKHI